jgi:hypothetical protein
MDRLQYAILDVTYCHVKEKTGGCFSVIEETRCRHGCGQEEFPLDTRPPAPIVLSFERGN